MEDTTQLYRISILQGNIWWRAFLDDPHYGQYKLKRLKAKLPTQYEYQMDAVPEVDIAEFMAIEKDRIPIIIATQFFTSPGPSDVFMDDQIRTVASVNLSALSGCLFGISIWQYKGSKPIKKLKDILFPNYYKMKEVLDYPFPEILQVEFGFKKRPPIFSQRTEIARTPVQHFQNMSYRDDFVPRKSNLGRARHMLLISNDNGATPMYVMSKSRAFDLGFFEFDSHQHMTSNGIIPATELIGVGQSIKCIKKPFLLLTPIDFYHEFKKRYHGPVDWEGLRLSWRHLTVEDGVGAPDLS